MSSCAFAYGRQIVSKECSNRPHVCGICQLNRGTRLMLKGISAVEAEKEFDYEYFVRGQRNGR